MTEEEFYKMCQTHDWTYMMSDDHRVWRNGCVAEDKLLALAPKGSKNREIYDSFQSYIFSGPAFSTEKKPYPSIPGKQ